MTSELHALSIAELGSGLRARRFTAEQLARHQLARIAAHDGTLAAFVRVCGERALREARAADRDFAGGVDRGPLQGIPYAVKDLFDSAGMPTGCNSRLRSNHIAREDSAAVARMSDGGAVLLGKLQLQEFATGGMGPDSPNPPSRNPWHPGHATGGSSSGAGVAVSAGFVRIALATDTGGSIRQPAAYCGAVGLKPTYGRVSRRGVFPLSHSMDHCGPITRSVEDAALALQVLAGFDPHDPASADVPAADYAAPLRAGVAGLRIGVPPGHMGLEPRFDPAVAASLAQATNALARGGAVVSRVALPDYDAFYASGMAIMLAEAYCVHQSDLQAHLPLYAAKTAERLLLGAAVTGADLVQAFRVRRRLTEALDTIFDGVDAILTASAIHGAPPLDGGDNMLAVPFQIPALPFNLTGHPALHVPTGRDGRGLPIGVQLIGPRFSEATLLRIAAVLEAASGWKEIPLPALTAV
ncbi:amidase [Ancylobacter amanitiformis]|uniref:Indoleacetamide hydrolase n=1 Tax=Ancylobacter amanitiformis TaxID=217069 RepID=A0ABU0LW04_9HYPH|nr:amidase [Ancylobacter amanitiformis]MDQ0512888.1 aspartyl-tRNA(Asn)/glutamyl-tRNA(Gln) amidotransferase subunit A [Ancylobacter amanitiformis]